MLNTHPARQGLLPLALMLTLLASGARAQAPCDRDCLRDLLDRYMAAVVAGDPEAAPLVVGFRQTENAVSVPPGGGVWQSVTALGELQRSYGGKIAP